MWEHVCASVWGRECSIKRNQQTTGGSDFGASKTNTRYKLLELCWNMLTCKLYMQVKTPKCLLLANTDLSMLIHCKHTLQYAHDCLLLLQPLSRSARVELEPCVGQVKPSVLAAWRSAAFRWEGRTRRSWLDQRRPRRPWAHRGRQTPGTKRVSPHTVTQLWIMKTASVSG